MNYFTSNWKSFVIGTTGLLVVLIFWEIISLQYNPLILPSPAETFTAARGLWYSGELWANLVITLQRTLLGYLLAIIAGIMLAFFLKLSTFWQYLFRPLVTIVQTTPPIVWLVLAVIWFGIADNLTPVFLIFIVTFPVIFINIFAGLDSIDMKLVEMARVYHCSKSKIIRKIYLPSLIPHIISAASIGLSFAWKSTIFAEYIGSSSGIGFALSMANSNLETDKLFAWALLLIVLMLIFEYGILQPLKTYVSRWNL